MPAIGVRRLGKSHGEIEAVRDVEGDGVSGLLHPTGGPFLTVRLFRWDSSEK